MRDLVEVLTHQQHGAAAVTGLDGAGVDFCEGGEIEAEAGVGHDQQIAFGRQFARQHGALHNATGLTSATPIPG